jgi:ankyrin repeat protein
MKRSTKSSAKGVGTADEALTEARAKAICLAINTNKVGDLATALTGCDINAPVYRVTPLFRAVMQARPEMVEFLLEHGADWRIRDAITRWTPLMMATINAHRSSRRHFPAAGRLRTASG